MSPGADLSVDEQRQQLLSWLDAAGDRSSATLRETHVSVLAFTSDRVWKCKKAVQLPFIDLSTLELRRTNCEREVALNRRLAPDVYLGVVPLVIDGEVVDYLVEMRRLPEDRMLSAVVASEGCAGGECVDAIADLLVRFHAHAPTGGEIDAAATPSALETLWKRSVEELRAAPSGLLDPATIARVESDAFRYLDGRASLFRDRISERRIRDGHGDLLADDVFCLAGGPQLLDCLEFDDRLRYGDVVGDIAFLAMDLERLGRADLASRLLARYRLESGDSWPASLEHFYVAYRALVRAKVACLRVTEDATAATSARALLALAARHLGQGRVRLVLVGGPPATGKTTTARELARVTGWPALHSDEIRKQLAGLAPAASAAAALGDGLYTPAWTDRTYTALVDRARDVLEHGESVILDASWSSEERRQEANALAARTGSELTSFVCDVPPQLAGQRAAQRAQQGTDASDAGAALAAALRDRFEPWPEAVVLDTSGAPERTADRMLAAVGLR
jgi:aminoglycoside phosphotransferase family enzyme/predicted kinase